MTYSSDIARDSHDVGFYVAFDGIEARVATEDFAATLSLSGTYLPVLDVSSLTAFSRTLDKDKHAIVEDGISFAIFMPDGVEGDDVRDVFRRRGGTQDRLDASMTSSSTVVDLGSATYADGSIVYIDRETIVLGSWGGSTYTGCTRGAFGSEAVPHVLGSIVDSVPRYWWTRGCRLVAVNRASGSERTLWHGNLSDTPSYSDGRLSFTATGRMNHILLSPIVTGWIDYEPESVELVDGGKKLRCRYGDPQDAFNFNFTSDDSFIRVDIGGSVGFYHSIDSGDPDYLEIDLTQPVPAGSYAGAGGYSTAYKVDVTKLADNPQVTLRQIGLVQGRCGHALIKVLLSYYGDLANDSVFDVLPGVPPTASGAAGAYRRRIGAAIPLSLVDRNSILQMMGGRDSDVYWLDEESNLGDFWAEIAWRTGGYLYIDDQGRVSSRRYTPVDVRASVESYDARETFLVSEVSTYDDERDAPARAVVEGNYDPVSGEYRRRLEIVWSEDAGIYERDGALSIKSKSIKLGSSGEGYASIEAAFDRARSRRIHSGRRHSYRMPWRLHEIMYPGARFSLSDSRLPDLEGGQGVSSRYVEVVSVRYDPATLHIVVDLDELPRGWQLCPSGYVALWAAPNLVLSDRALTAGGVSTLSNKATEFPSGGHAAVRIFDASATPPFSVSTLLGILSVSGDTIITTGTPSFTPAPGDVAVYTSSRGIDSTNANVHGANTEDFAFGADGGVIFKTLAGEKAGPKWG